MLDAVFSYLISKMIDMFPGLVTRRFISPTKLAEMVEVDLRRASPINISFGSSIPSLSLWFRISNKSLVNLVLDRLLIDLWIGQPFLHGAILSQYIVSKQSSIENAYFNTKLTNPQQDWIRKHVSGQLLSVPVTITVEAYFESKVGTIRVEQRIEHRTVPGRLQQFYITKITER